MPQASAGEGAGGGAVRRGGSPAAPGAAIRRAHPFPRAGPTTRPPRSYALMRSPVLADAADRVGAAASKDGRFCKRMPKRPALLRNARPAGLPGRIKPSQFGGSIRRPACRPAMQGPAGRIACLAVAHLHRQAIDRAAAGALRPHGSSPWGGLPRRRRPAARSHRCTAGRCPDQKAGALPWLECGRTPPPDRRRGRFGRQPALPLLPRAAARRPAHVPCMPWRLAPGLYRRRGGGGAGARAADRPP